MLVKSFSALAVLAFVAQASASEPMPYKPQPKLMKMSIRDLFGVERRQTGDGYQPTQSECGAGVTCADACGAGYQTCTSGDNAVHCFNPAAAETCCPDGTGNSCEAGYYCTGDNKGETWCCPNGMDLVACAQAYSVSGALTSEIAKPTSTSTSTSSSTSTTTTSTSTTTKKAVSSTIGYNTTTSCTSTVSGSATFAAANTTATVPVVSSTTSPSPSKVSQNAGSLMAPAGALAVFVAAGLSALL
ncbi:hypothetical protein GQ53DRAFT_816067 [Thozetella sp. PMI_491]|nr:hypothetical protein GQ53DRAFT_816067 [Thozetella sp. PMI_491]